MTGSRTWGDVPDRLVPAYLTAAATLCGALVTLAVWGSPFISFGYHNPTLHLVLDSVDACVALLLARLLQGRYARTLRLGDGLLADGLWLLGLTGLVLAVLTSLSDASSWLLTWGPATLRLLGALLIGVGAFAALRRVPAPTRPWVRVAPWIGVVATVGLLWVVGRSLPDAVEVRTSSGDRPPILTGHPALLAAHGLSMAAFFFASAAFTVLAVRRPDALRLWLGPGFALAGFARLNYLLFPSLYSGWLFTGDLLRTASYAVLLVGAAREIGRYWSAQARAAVLDDRRRLARELHDGVVQELGFIRAEAALLVADAPRAKAIVDACDRGLDEARAAVDALGTGSEEPLGYALHRAARQVAERYGAQVVVEVDDAVEADLDQRHALVRITREAMLNAIRHGGAECTRITLRRDGNARRLVVSDDGRGFAPEQSARVGYGLTSMRERAQALPGQFHLESAPGEGTEVSVVW